MPQLHVMIKPASGLCNMRCRYCFYADEMEKRNQASYGIMSAQTLEHVIQAVFDFADEQCTIDFQGGEPTLAGLDFYRQCLKLEKKYNTKHKKYPKHCRPTDTHWMMSGIHSLPRTIFS